LKRKGFRMVLGLDEAGRGALVGPVVAAATAVAAARIPKSLKGVKDSKKLNQKQREELYKILTKRSDIQWATSKVSEKIIDKINILQSTRLAMKRAVRNLERKMKNKADFLILDGKIKIDLATSQKSIIKADEKVFSCSCASVIAKVTRDRIMEREHKKYPEYNFSKHKGYPTKQHREMLEKYGPCEIHRMSFKPVAESQKSKVQS